MSDTEQLRPLHLFPRRSLIKGSALLAGSVLAGGSTVQRVLAGANPVQLRAWETALAQSTPEAIAAYTPVALTPTELTTLIV